MPFQYTPIAATVLRVSGEDAFTYLQGQCTADLRKGNCHHTLWLNRKGRVQAYAIAARQTDLNWLVISPSSKAEELTLIISSNLIADDVQIENQSMQWQVGVLWGEEMPSGPVDCQFIPTGGYGVKAWYVLSPIGLKINWPISAADDLESIRIQHGVPKVPADCGSGEFPQECGLDAWISYTKGCYLGQEVMARIQSMGSLRRVLRCVTSINGTLSTGQELRRSDDLKICGVVKSVAGKAGLALVSIDWSDGDLLSTDDGEVRLGRVAQLGVST